MAIVNFERFERFVTENDTLTLRASEYLRVLVSQLNLSTVLTGSGSPEGIVTAEPTQQYMDTAGTANTILYIKKTGSGNTGWILT